MEMPNYTDYFSLNLNISSSDRVHCRIGWFEPYVIGFLKVPLQSCE